MNKIQQLHDQIVEKTELAALHTHRGDIAPTAVSIERWYGKAHYLEAEIANLELEFFNLSKSL